MQSLDRLGLDENTIVIYTADHGFSLGHNGVWGHGAAAFPASAHRPSYHIPLIVSGGPVQATGPQSSLVSQIDLFPTLASLVSADLATPSLPSSAQDLTPTLIHGTKPTASAVFMEQEETRAIRSKDWLYAARFKGAPSFIMHDELYDLRADPLEKTNLIDHGDHAATAKDLQAQVDAFFSSYAAPAYDLWNGGSAKSNVTYDQLWIDAWGSDWQPKISS